MRAGLAFSFAYAGIGGFLHPENWIGWFPLWTRNILPLGDRALLGTFGVIEILLALWLLSGKKLCWSALISGILLIGITAVNLTSMDIVFRDIALGLVAFGLALSRKESATA